MARLFFPTINAGARSPDVMELIWAPHVIQNVKDSDLGLYMEFSCTACIPGGTCNVDRALEVLYHAHGDIKLALERLMTRPEALDVNNNDTSDSTSKSNVSGRSIWTEDEVHLFERYIMLNGKNFYHISQAIKTKSVKQCVEFYYLWKRSPFKKSSVSPVATRSVTSSLDDIATPSDTTTSGEIKDSQEEQFPCKVCGRIFLKIKSRSAHMKRHKNER